jgi:hypothetical protein
MKKLVLIVIGLSLLSTVSIGCKAEGKIDTTASPQVRPIA